MRYLFRDTDRHGNRRIYFWRRNGDKKVRLREPEGSPQFLARYAELLAASLPIIKVQRDGQTFRQLVVAFIDSPTFKASASDRTQYTSRRLLEGCCQEPWEDGTMADVLVAEVTIAMLSHLVSIKVLEGYKEAANNRVRAIRRLFKWAKAQRLIVSNPAADLERIENKSDGWHTWTTAELTAFEKRHPVGTKARLALDLLQYTGLSRVDVVAVGEPNAHTVDGKKVLRYRRGKSDVEANVAMAEPLLNTLAATNDKGTDTWLHTEFGKSYSPNGFGNRFKEWCRAAELPEVCSAHGVRKAAATRAAENGATTHELMAMFGWLTVQEAERYTKQANRRKLGMAGARLLKK